MASQNTSRTVLLSVVSQNTHNFNVEYQGKIFAVKKLEFQRHQAAPEKLSCVVDIHPNGYVKISQNHISLLKARYHKGMELQCVIDSDMTNASEPHYKVSDGSGFWFKVKPKGRERYAKGDHVICRVNGQKGATVDLSIIGRRPAEPLEAPTLEQMDEALDGTLSCLIEKHSDAESARHAEELRQRADHEWITSMLLAVRRRLEETTLEEATAEDPDISEVLVAFRRWAEWLLEDSGYTRLVEEALGNEARAALQEQLVGNVVFAEGMLKAVAIARAGEQEEFIARTLSKMKTSGFLYNPELRLSALRALLSFCPAWMDSHISQIMEVLVENYPSTWKGEPYRTAFLHILRLYIRSNAPTFDTIGAIETPEDDRRLDSLLLAMAAELLLRNEKAEPDGDPLSLPRLYRYFSLKPRTGDIPQVLETALSLLMLDSEERRPDFGWNDLTEASLFTRLRAAAVDGLSRHATFAADNVSLNVNSSGITLRNSPKASNQYPSADMPMWHNLRVLTDMALPTEERDAHNILTARAAWADIERIFLSPETLTAQKRPRTLQPERGDKVDIIITGEAPSIDGKQTFAARIVSDIFAGNGSITIDQITGSAREVNPDHFSNQEGFPYILPAKVASIDSEGVITFSMRDAAGDFVAETLAESIGSPDGDDIFNAVVTAAPRRKGGKYTALTEYGFAVWLDPGELEELAPGNCLRLRVLSCSPDGHNIEAVALDRDAPKVEYDKAASNLILSLSDDHVCEEAIEEDTSGIMAELLDEDEAAEVMMLTGRYAELPRIEYAESYAHASLARLMARVLGRESMASFFAHRCSVLEMLDDFARNGRVSLESLERISALADGPASSEDVTMLRILTALDRNDLSEPLWRIASTGDGSYTDKVVKLARLVLAYNALDGFKFAKERKAIRQQIYTELELHVEAEPEQIADGTESQQLEFKTSLAYPAGNNMRRDINRQTKEILTVICGFLNTTGGRLYIGVSDEGYIRGLENDLEVFGSRDKMDLHLRNELRRAYKFMANQNQYITTSWETHSGRDVYVVDIRPYPELVTIDGVPYERQGTSTLWIPESEREAFIKRRNPVPGDEESPLPEAPAEEEAITDFQPDALNEPEPVYSPSRPSVEKIMTSELRHNVLHETDPDYRHVAQYIYLYPDRYEATDTDRWCEEDTSLTLGLTPPEAEGSLIALYSDGSAVRLSAQDLIDGSGRFATGANLRFLSPAAEDAGLVIYYTQGRDMYIQSFGADSIRAGRVNETGELLLPRGSEVVRAEIIPADRLPAFSNLRRNGQRIKDLELSISQTYHKLS